MKHLLVSYVYTDALGNQKFHYKEIFVELSGGLSDIDKNKELVQEVEKKTPRGSCILNIVDLATISQGPCVDAIGRDLVKRMFHAYVMDIDEEGPKMPLPDLLQLMDEVKQYLAI